MENFFQDIAALIGWIGAIMLVSTYFLLNRGFFIATSRRYQLFNLIASFLLGWSAISYKAWFSVTLNLFWVIVSLYGLVKATSK